MGNEDEGAERRAFAASRGLLCPGSLGSRRRRRRRSAAHLSFTLSPTSPVTLGMYDTGMLSTNTTPPPTPTPTPTPTQVRQIGQPPWKVVADHGIQPWVRGCDSYMLLTASPRTSKMSTGTSGCTTNATCASPYCCKHGGGKKPCSVAGCTTRSERTSLLLTAHVRPPAFAEIRHTF